MDLRPFWSDDYPRPPDLPVADELPGRVDVAVIGGGYTGLSAARTLARAGATVAVLEAETIGWGASSRNGGITGCGLKRSTPAVFHRYGERLGHVFWQASLEALELVRELATEEGIDCDFRQEGDLCVAVKPEHLDGFRKKIAWHRKTLGHELQLVPAAELAQEIGSRAYHGGLVDPHGAGLHPAKLVFGLARVAAKYGALLCERAAVTGLEKLASGFRVHTRRGSLQAKEVLAATNGYTDRAVRGLKARLIPIGSYCIATEPLSEDLRAEISPRGRVFWDSKWFLNYFRLTPDGRLLWGGRSNLGTQLDLAGSARILKTQMLRAFPQLAGAAVSHSWSGQLGLTFDMMPHIGRVGGVHYAAGYGGHGLHTALYLGREVALLLTGRKSASPFADIPHPTWFFYRNSPWFLPFVSAYYRLRDRFS